MKKIFANFWTVFIILITVGILDLIFITTIDFGFGFVAALLYFIGYIIYWSKS